jgi:hypothetical protein
MERHAARGKDMRLRNAVVADLHRANAIAAVWLPDVTTSAEKAGAVCNAA